MTFNCKLRFTLLLWRLINQLFIYPMRFLRSIAPNIIKATTMIIFFTSVIEKKSNKKKRFKMVILSALYQKSILLLTQQLHKLRKLQW